MRVLIVLMLVFCVQHLYAQNKGSITGYVFSNDSTSLVKATISIINPIDSSVLSYTISDDKGKFQFVRLPVHKVLKIYISHINSNPYTKDFEIDNSQELDFGRIILDGKMIDEVVVTAAPPIRMNKDTLEYNADYFKTRPNANVEELLKELPGLQVNMDGTIYYQGKEVSQVKVNGKDFFASDFRIATRNLDASLVKTVQVYRDRGESKKTVENEENLPITINLKFKKELLRTDFGKAYASGGTRDRYEAGALFNTFRDTLQLSFIGYGNNINRESFDYNELNQHAGLGRSENYGFNDFGGRNYWGLANNIGLGFNLNYDWGKKTKLNVMYMFKRNNTYSDNNYLGKLFLDEYEESSSYNSSNSQKENQHNITTLFRHRFDTTMYLEFKPRISFSNNSSSNQYNSYTLNGIDSLNGNSSNSTSIRQNQTYGHDLFFEKQINPKHLFSFKNSIDYNSNNTNNVDESLTKLFKEEKQNTNIWNNNIEESLSNNIYLHTSYQNKMLKKLNFDTYISARVLVNKPTESLHYNRDNTGLMHGKEFENSYKLTTRDYISGIRFYYKPKTDLDINFGTAFQIKYNYFDFISINSDRNIKNTYWLPNINVRYKNLNASWSKDVNNPHDNIRTQVYNLNPGSTQLPSLNFDPVETQNASISFNKYNQKVQFGTHWNYNYEDKSAGYKSWMVPNTGQHTGQSYQSGSKYRYSGSFYFRYNLKGSKNWQYYISSSPHAYTYQNYNTINDIENKSTQLGVSWNQEFSISWKNIIAIAPKYKIDIRNNTNSVKDNPDFKNSTYVTHDIGAGLNITGLKRFNIETSYSLQNRASGMNERNNFHIINTSLYYNLKNNSQLKLTGFDILNQNNSTYWGRFGNRTHFQNSTVLKQYFLLGYIHKFNISKTKE